MGAPPERGERHVVLQRIETCASLSCWDAVGSDELNFFDGKESVTHVGTQGRVVDHVGFEIAHRDWTECSKSVLSES